MVRCPVAFARALWVTILPSLALVLSVLYLFALPGCGGGGSSPKTGSAAILVTWPARSRLIPAASNSIKATFSRNGQTLATQTIVRPAGGGQTTTTFDGLPTGDLTLAATAYPNADATGVAQAQGGSTVTIVGGQTANVTLSLDSTITHVEVTPSAPTVTTGKTLPLIATATDAAGSVVLVEADRLQWTSGTAAAATVDANGVVTGVATGTSAITVTDTESGKSGSVTVTVANAAVVISPASVSLLINGQQGFSATVTGQANTAVGYTIQEGAAGGSIDASGSYIAPPTPGTYHVVATSLADPTQSATATVTVTALTNPNPAGLYFTDYFNNRVIHVDDMTGANWHAFAGFAAQGSFRFTGIQRLALDSAGRIYVTDWMSHRISRMDDITGKNLVTFGTLGSGVGQFNQPLAVSIGPDGRIYIADYQNNRIVRMDDMTGAGWTTYGTAGTGVGQFTLPQGVWVDRANHIYVADTFGNRIARIDDMSGAGWVAFGTGVSPTSVAVASDGRIYFTDYYNNRIGTAADMTGAGLTFLGSTTPGTGVGQFHFPSPIFVGSDGHVYLADTGNNRVVRMDDITGAGWSAFGAFGTGTGQFESPVGIVLYP